MTNSPSSNGSTTSRNSRAVVPSGMADGGDPSLHPVDGDDGDEPEDDYSDDDQSDGAF